MLQDPGLPLNLIFFKNKLKEVRTLDGIRNTFGQGFGELCRHHWKEMGEKFDTELSSQHWQWKRKNGKPECGVNFRLRRSGAEHDVGRDALRVRKSESVMNQQSRVNLSETELDFLDERVEQADGDISEALALLEK